MSNSENREETNKEHKVYCFGNGQIHQLYLQDKVGALNTMKDIQKLLIPIEKHGETK